MQILSNPNTPSGQPSLPSPTLTNPDMILPYDSSSSSDSTPSTPRRVHQIPSPPLQGDDQDGGGDMKGAMRKLFRSSGGHSKLQKRNRGEKPESKSSTHKSSFETSGSSLFASSQTLYDGSEIHGANITGQNGKCWGDLDSVADGGRGSPYEEPADSKDVGPPKFGFAPLDNEKDGFSPPPEIDDDTYSHAAMSIRAEQILANAKKRLTNMEGNLNRARSTLHNRSSSSMSSFSNRSPDPVSLYTIPQGNFSPNKHRQAKSSSSATNDKGHNRVFSETSVPSSLHTPTQSREQSETQTGRASSAMGSSSLNAPGEFNPDNPHNWFWTGLTRNTTYANRHNYSLPALKEDGPAPETFEPLSITNDDILEEDEEEKAETNLIADPKELAKSPHVGPDSSPPIGLTRARSTTQMRDLRDQMQDLKGKISSLKRRAREDSMRRRSMQSLRTPSPFTAAENWYGDDSGLRQRSPKLGNGVGNCLSDGKHHSEESDNSRERIEGTDQIEAPQSIGKSSDESDFDLTPRNVVPSQATSDSTEIGELLETPTKLSRSEESTFSSSHESSGALKNLTGDSNLTAERDSLYGDQDYHETSTSQAGERHEDRPDAFDYETFFLHSGTGTLARKGHSRNSSHSSIYSVETTKPTYTLIDSPGDLSNNDTSPIKATTRRSTSRQKERSHSRSGSVESISTVATFATATEGKDSDGEGDEDDWIHRPMAGAWANDQSAKRKFGSRSVESPSSDNARTSSKRSAPFRKAISITNGTESVPVPIPSVPAHHLDAGPLSPSSASLAILSREAAQLPEGDKKLVEMLVNSLTKVCARLKDASVESGPYDQRPWRGKLDHARRILDGEMNGEVF